MWSRTSLKVHGKIGSLLLTLACLSFRCGEGKWLYTARHGFPTLLSLFYPESGVLQMVLHVAMGPLPSKLWASLPSVLSYNSLDLEFLFIKRYQDSISLWPV